MRQNIETNTRLLISRIKKLPTAIQKWTEVYDIKEDEEISLDYPIEFAVKQTYRHFSTR